MKILKFSGTKLSWGDRLWSKSGNGSRLGNGQNFHCLGDLSPPTGKKPCTRTPQYARLLRRGCTVRGSAQNAAYGCTLNEKSATFWLVFRFHINQLSIVCLFSVTFLHNNYHHHAWLIHTGKLCHSGWHVPLDATASFARVERGGWEGICTLWLLDIKWWSRQHYASYCQLHLQEVTIKWWMTLWKALWQTQLDVIAWFRPELPQCTNARLSSSLHSGRCHHGIKWHMPLLSWVA